MCELLTISTEEKIEGYKVVAKKLRGKRYFSISMGFKYPLDGHIPIVRKQHQICGDFTNNIFLEGSGAYRKNMVGRTAVFLNLKEISRNGYFLTRNWRKDVKKGYKLVIVQAEISIDIMEGVYCGYKVAAGRHIRFIKEIEELS